MTIILTAKEVLELSKWYLDIEPNPEWLYSGKNEGCENK